jgi:hypothetical protein
MVEWKLLFVTDAPKRMFHIEVKFLHLSWQESDAGLPAPSVEFYHTTRYRNPERGTVRSHRSENVIFCN